MFRGIDSFPTGVPLLLMNSLLMYLGFFALIPYLSYHLTASLLWTPFLAGILLMIRQFTQQGLSFIAGLVADRIGYKLMITCGLFVRGFGFSMFAFAEHTVSLFLAAIITGLGGAAFDPTSNAALSALTPLKDRGRMFSVRKILSNVGIALASLVGALLIQFDFMYISLVCGGLFMLISVLTYLKLPNITVQIQHIPFQTMWQSVIHDRHFVLFTLVTVGFYFMFMQLFLTIPIHAVQITKHPQAVSLVLLLFSITIIISQYFVNKWMSRFELIPSLKIGLAMMGVGLVFLGIADQLTLFVFGLLIFAFGSMISEPTTFDLISRFAKPNLLASYFGFANLGMALGGGLSQGLGGLLLQFGERINVPSLLWWVAGGVALTSIIGLHFLEKTISNTKRLVGGNDLLVTKHS